MGFYPKENRQEEQAHGSCPTTFTRTSHTTFAQSFLTFLRRHRDEVELCERLGAGGSARVYRGVLRGVSVAVKVWDLELLKPRERELVQDEAEMMMVRRRLCVALMILSRLFCTVVVASKCCAMFWPRHVARSCVY